MDGQLLWICGLTFLIHVIGTLAYSVRIAGTRTGRIAVSFALFNILVLVSRTSNTFQTPMLAKRVEEKLLTATLTGTAADFRWLLLAAAVATLAGAVLIPTFQRIFTLAVASFSVHRSLPRLLLHGFSKAGLQYLRDSVRTPSVDNVSRLRNWRAAPLRVAVLNTVAVSLWTVGVFSALYASYLNPDLRVTAGMLSGVVNGLATILLFVAVDPYLSVVTDDVVEGKATEAHLRHAITWMVGSRFAGTVLAQLLLIPGAVVIVHVAAWL